MEEAVKLTDEFIQYYNYERIQGNGLTPYEERQAALERTVQPSGALPPNPQGLSLLFSEGTEEGTAPTVPLQNP